MSTPIFQWNIQPSSSKHQQLAQDHQNQLTKPAGALGTLEEISIKLAGFQQSVTPSVRPAETLIFASDHPVSNHGVSAYPREVTQAMVKNLVEGGAAASVLCRQLQIPLTICNVGVENSEKLFNNASQINRASQIKQADTLPHYPTPHYPTPRYVTFNSEGQVGNLIDTPAMDTKAFELAALAGEKCTYALDKKTKILILGEMGIGNTTPATALLAWSLSRGKPSPRHEELASLVGPGTGVAGSALSNKTQIIKNALQTFGQVTDPIKALKNLGGREIVAIASAMGSAAERGIAILVDGFVVSSAALIACQINPKLKEWLIFSHTSAEPAHKIMLDCLDAAPLINANMRLGEGTGALAAFPLLECATACHNNMATFDQAQVPDIDKYPA